MRGMFRQAAALVNGGTARTTGSSIPRRRGPPKPLVTRPGATPGHSGSEPPRSAQHCRARVLVELLLGVLGKGLGHSPLRFVAAVQQDAIAERKRFSDL